MMVYQAQLALLAAPDHGWRSKLPRDSHGIAIDGRRRCSTQHLGETVGRCGRRLKDFGFARVLRGGHEAKVEIGYWGDGIVGDYLDSGAT